MAGPNPKIGVGQRYRALGGEGVINPNHRIVCWWCVWCQHGGGGTKKSRHYGRKTLKNKIKTLKLKSALRYKVLTIKRFLVCSSILVVPIFC